MASSHLHLLIVCQSHHPNLRKRSPSTMLKCSSEEWDPNFPSPDPNFSALNKAESFPIERRRRSEIARERRPSKDMVKGEPPNFEIGWKRTKEINVEKPVGWAIMDFLEKLEILMEREQFGSAELLGKVGEIVAERAREEAEILREDAKVDERKVTELFRVLKLMEMDLQMLNAAVKDDTFTNRLANAKARCRQAILVATSF